MLLWHIGGLAKTVMCINHMIRDKLELISSRILDMPLFRQHSNRVKVRHGITLKISPKIFPLLNSMNQNLDVIFLMDQE